MFHFSWMNKFIEKENYIFSKKLSKVDIDDKLDKLIETIEYCINRIQNDENTELLEIYKLYC